MRGIVKLCCSCRKMNWGWRLGVDGCVREREVEEEKGQRSGF